MKIGLFSLAMSLLLAASVSASEEHARVKIEFYFYINGDNDLVTTDGDGTVVHQGDKIFSELSLLAEKAPQESAFHIYYDPNGFINTAGGDRNTDTVIKRYAQGIVQSEEKEEETDSSDPKYLQKLLSQSYGASSAKVVVFWGHGSGWKNVRSYDFSSPETEFSYVGLGPILSSYGVNLVIFDACQMGYLEVLSAYAPYVPYIVASQFEVPLEGIKFSRLNEHIGTLLSDMDRSDQETLLIGLFRKLNADTIERQMERRMFAPLVFYRTAGLDSVLSKLREITVLLMTRVESMGERKSVAWDSLINLSRPRRDASWRGDRDSVDLRAFAYQLKRRMGIDAAQLVDSFLGISDRGFGSVQFYLPAEFGKISDSSRGMLKSFWNQNMANWDLVRKWSDTAGGTL